MSDSPEPLTAQYVPGIFDSRVLERLAQWEVSREKGAELTIEELCKDLPELADAVRQGMDYVDQQQNTRDYSSSTIQPPGKAGMVPSLPERLSDGKYEIRGMLGKGGMGVVYRAWDRERQCEVALKTLPASNSASLLRFKQEFRSLADHYHRNLVTLHELCHEETRQGSFWYFTMELVEGSSFVDYVRPAAFGRVLNENRLRQALQELTLGVRALHKADKLHRDLKPSNVLATTTGRVVLLDFGLAAELNPQGFHQSVTGQVLGTLAYMAPEQAAGKAVSKASDWYAVGTMLFEALTDRLPFANSFASLFSKQSSEAPSVIQYNPDAPADLCELCRRLLLREPDQRADGREILQVLDKQPRSDETKQVFVGRKSLIDQLNASGEKVRKGTAVGVLLSGVSGVGKSSLLRQFFQQLPGDAVVLQARCYEREAVPYKAIDGAVDSLCRHLQRLPKDMVLGLLPRKPAALVKVFPVFREVTAVDENRWKLEGSAEAPELRARAFAGLREVFSRLGDRGLVVLALDDVQWGDLDSAALLTELLHVPEPPDILTLIVHREEMAGEAVTQAFRRSLPLNGSEAELLELQVPPLSADEVGRLAGQLMGRTTTEAIEKIVAEASGLPLFVQELVQSSREGKVLSLEEALQQRMGKLESPSRRVLEVLAVAGVPVPGSACLRAAGLHTLDIETIHELLNEQLIRRSGKGTQIAVYHDRIGEMVRSQLPAEQTAQILERLVSEMTGDKETNAETIAAFFIAAHRHKHGPFALQVAIQAAERAKSSLAFNQAAQWYQAALELPGITEMDFKEAVARVAARQVGVNPAEQPSVGSESTQRKLGRVRTARVEIQADIELDGTPLLEQPMTALKASPDVRDGVSSPRTSMRSAEAGHVSSQEGRYNWKAAKKPGTSWLPVVMAIILVVGIIVTAWILVKAPISSQAVTQSRHDAKPVDTTPAPPTMVHSTKVTDAVPKSTQPYIHDVPPPVTIEYLEFAPVPGLTLLDQSRRILEQQEPGAVVRSFQPPDKHSVVINDSGAARGTSKSATMPMVKSATQPSKSTPGMETIPFGEKNDIGETKQTRTMQDERPGLPWLQRALVAIVLAGVFVGMVHVLIRRSGKEATPPPVPKPVDRAVPPEVNIGVSSLTVRDPWRASIEAELGDSLAYAGRRSEAAMAYQRAIVHADDSRRDELQRKLDALSRQSH